MRYLLILILILIWPFVELHAFTKSWKGQSIRAVVLRLGQPSIVNHLRNGNTIYIFSIRRPKIFALPQSSPAAVIALPGGKAIGVPSPAFSTPNAPSLSCTLTFVADRRGTILQQQAEGACE